MLIPTLVGRIDGLHTHVETQDEVVEIQSDTHTIRRGYLLIELVYLKLPVWLVGIVAKRPDVTRIHKQGTLELPEERGAILGIQVELQVTRLVDEVDASVIALVSAWSQFSYTPTPHRVGSTREISLLERQHGAVAVRISHSQVGMQRQGIAVVETDEVGIVEIEFGILCIGDVEKGALPLRINLESQGIGESAEQISGRLHIESDGIHPITIRESESHLHDEKVFVVISQDGISIVHIIQVIALESL